MKNAPKHHDSGRADSITKKRRQRRTRPVPQWLTGSTELDTIARRRCLMILSVLSGERPVTEVIEDLELSRQMYYLLETKALNAMLSALVPGSERASADPSATSPAKRIAELEEKVKRLEQSKRRGEHMLFLTRQVLGPGPVKLGRGGRPSKKVKKAKATSSKTAGLAHSARSKISRTKRTMTKRSSATTEPTKSSSISSPTLDGADGR